MDFIKNGLPFWIAGGIVAIVMYFLNKWALKNLGSQKSQALRQQTKTAMENKYPLSFFIKWMLVVPVLVGVVVFMVLWFFVLARK